MEKVQINESKGHSKKKILKRRRCQVRSIGLLWSGRGFDLQGTWTQDFIWRWKRQLFRIPNWKSCRSRACGSCLRVCFILLHDSKYDSIWVLIGIAGIARICQEVICKGTLLLSETNIPDDALRCCVPWGPCCRRKRKPRVPAWTPKSPELSGKPWKPLGLHPSHWAYQLSTIVYKAVVTSMHRGFWSEASHGGLDQTQMCCDLSHRKIFENLEVGCCCCCYIFRYLPLQHLSTGPQGTIKTQWGPGTVCRSKPTPWRHGKVQTWDGKILNCKTENWKLMKLIY